MASPQRKHGLRVSQLLVLEGAANALLYANLGAALQYWGAQTGNFIDYIVLGSASNVTQSSLDEFSENLALIGINFAEVDGMSILLRSGI